MKRWIGAAAVVAITVGAAGYAGAEEREPGPSQEIQYDRDPPPGAENMNKRAERAQSVAPMNGSQGQKPTDAQRQARDKSGQSE
jgi:hypothetical protein